MATWNPWHGCTKTSAGCAHCYVYRRDAEFERDASVVHKTASFDLPLRKNRQKEYKLQPDGDYVYTCFTSDFFHPDADSWRSEAWAMMKARPDLEFYFVTKRPERFSVGLPADWGSGYENVHISAAQTRSVYHHGGATCRRATARGRFHICTCENQSMTRKRLRFFTYAAAIFIPNYSQALAATNHHHKTATLQAHHHASRALFPSLLLRYHSWPRNKFYIEHPVYLR